LSAVKVLVEHAREVLNLTVTGNRLFSTEKPGWRQGDYAASSNENRL